MVDYFAQIEEIISKIKRSDPNNANVSNAGKRNNRRNKKTTRVVELFTFRESLRLTNGTGNNQNRQIRRSLFNFGNHFRFSFAVFEL